MEVVELFAGVGGFRLGLELVGQKFYKVIFSNQWEPSTKRQHANEVYEARFGSRNHSGEDISQVVERGEIPNHQLLVGGFPCQDYSVATSLKNSAGLYGKKGVLWWQINRILKEKKVKPKYLILENVDRLIKSPSNQRGRDMAIILKCLENLGYSVEWRVVNGAEYGFPQRRRRLFLVGYYKTTKQFSELKNDMEGWIESEGVISKSFPIKKISSFQRLDISKSDIKDISSVT